jgi:hypothetical protein
MHAGFEIMKKAGTEILFRLSEQTLELVTVFNEASRNFKIIIIWQSKNVKAICACTESNDII